MLSQIICGLSPLPRWNGTPAIFLLLQYLVQNPFKANEDIKQLKNIIVSFKNPCQGHKHLVSVSYSSLLLPVSKWMDLNSPTSWALNHIKGIINKWKKWYRSFLETFNFLQPICIPSSYSFGLRSLRLNQSSMIYFQAVFGNTVPFLFIFCNWSSASRHSPAPI